MARPPKSAADGETPSLIASEQVTYRPINDGDPIKTKWRGLVFHANVPKTVSDAELIEAAKGNKHFHVGPFDPQKDGASLEETRDPKTANEYRAYVLAWLKRIDTLDELIKQWKADTALRGQCEVGSDDLMFLGQFLDPKIDAICKRDGIQPLKQAEMWASYGINDIPWRGV